ncbi:nuclear transport factor 2 family protein [Actinomycetospora lutea]|uniref:nuclear transport factor 2 family protein n=1 Tax=Actinomycetospora lutea TaxID=663604 RepID=UPI0023660C79|nr:nuclear transport factor 2 family protein [Actinomycetospora lutea]MDD7940319.1 nuclear transport factor 2 family protein [Actinomycetospora lutea]
MTTFRAAVERGDIDAAVALLAEDVAFSSPVVHTPYRGRDAVAPILRAVFTVFEDFRYVDEIGGGGGEDHVLVFRARVGDRELEGIDLLHHDASGAIDRLTVMIRPLSALQAVATTMREELGG